MDHLEKSLKHVKEQKDQLDHKRKQVALEAGRIFFSREPDNIGKLHKDSLERLLSFDNSIQSRKDRIDEISQYRIELQQDQTKKKTIEDLAEKKEKALMPWIEKTGTAVLKAVENGNLPQMVDDSEITDVIKSKKELHNLKAEAETLERQASQKTFLKKTLKKGKILIIQGNIKTREVIFQRSIKHLGKRFLFEDFAEYTPEIQAVLEEIDPQRQELLKLKDQLQELTESIDHHMEQIDAGQMMEGTRHPEKKLEEEIEELQKSKDSIHLKVGLDILEGEEVPSDLKESASKFSEIVKEIESVQHQAIQLQAVIDLHHLEKTENTLKERLENIKQDLARKKEQKKNLENEIKALEQEKEEKLKIKGDFIPPAE